MADWILPGLTLLSLAAWVHLLLGRGGYWRAAERLAPSTPELESWPAVAAIVPARNEADVIAESIGSLLRQDYPGPFRVVLVDDQSDDGTAARARAAAVAWDGGARLELIEAEPLPVGWSGKLWALTQGIGRARALLPDAAYFWLSDADIAHDPAILRRLVAKAEKESCDQVSLMVLLQCGRPWEKLLIPPFVLFFQKLYPFAWANDPGRRMAAAAGGCNLVARAAFEGAGGYEPIKSALIDDCSLAQRIKPVALERGRRTWLGLTRSSRSLRPYRGLGEIWAMVARSAYTQLEHSPLLLLGTVIGMSLLYLLPPLAAVTSPWHGSPVAGLAALAAWAIMTITARPTFRLYRQAPWRLLLLPLAALLYTAMTFDSALRHWRGHGGLWKGRIQAPDTKGARRLAREGRDT